MTGKRADAMRKEHLKMDRNSGYNEFKYFQNTRKEVNETEEALGDTDRK